MIHLYINKNVRCSSIRVFNYLITFLAPFALLFRNLKNLKYLIEECFRDSNWRKIYVSEAGCIAQFPQVPKDIKFEKQSNFTNMPKISIANYFHEFIPWLFNFRLSVNFRLLTFYIFIPIFRF